MPDTPTLAIQQQSLPLLERKNKVLPGLSTTQMSASVGSQILPGGYGEMQGPCLFLPHLIS